MSSDDGPSDDEHNECESSLEALPTELLLEICVKLTFRDLMAVACVCKRLNLVSQNDLLWQLTARSMDLSIPSCGGSSVGSSFLRSQRRCVQCNQLFTVAQNRPDACKRHPGNLIKRSEFFIACKCDGFACIEASRQRWSCCGYFHSCMPVGCTVSPHNASSPASPKIVEIGFTVKGES
jgi:hypothetical protein